MTDLFTNASFEDTSTLGPDIVTSSAAYADDTATYPIAPIGANALNVKIDSGNEQILYFIGTETTAAEISATLDIVLVGAKSYVSGGQVRIESLTTGQYSFVEVTGGTANASFLFPTNQNRGDDGSFEGDGIANWTSIASVLTKQSGTRTGGTGDSVFRITATGAPDARASQVILTVGKTYRLQAWARGDGTCIPAVTFDVTYDMFTGTATLDWQEIDVTFVAQSTSLELKGTNAAAALYVEYDDVTVKQVFSSYGDASPWHWNSSQSVGGFAEFNSVEPMPAGTPRGYESGSDFHLVTAYRAGREDFIAGWDDNHLWYSALPTPSAAEYNENAPVYLSTIESFEIWDGANWIDGDPTYISPYDETVPTGWNGWYNDDLSKTTLPLEIESFDESWNNDPFHSGYTWYAATALTGVLYSSALTFPLSIGSWQEDIHILMRSATDDLYKLSITPQSFTNVSNLVSHLNSLLPAALTNAGFIFASWTSGTSTGITWGWNGSKNTSGTAYETYFVTIQREAFYKDARVPLGLNTLGWNNKQNSVLFPSAILTVKPVGVLATDTLIADSWSQVKYSSNNPYGTLILSVYGQTAAIFNSSIASEDHQEQFLIDGWFGAGSAWKSVYVGPPPAPGADLAPATFTGAVDIEQFVNTDWPNELMP